MNKYVTFLFFLLFCRGTSIFAQVRNQPIERIYTNPEFFEEGKEEVLSDTVQKNTGAKTDNVNIGTINQQNGGSNNKQINIDNNIKVSITNNVVKNEKELSRIIKELEQSGLKQDSILLMLRENEKKWNLFLSEIIVQKDSVHQVLENEKNELQRRFDALADTLKQLNNQKKMLEEIIEKQKQGNFLPLGIKQFRNGKKALGYTFLLSEIAVPVALGVGLEHAANQKYNEYKHQKAQTLSDHEAYYKKYKRYHRAAIWAPVAAEAFVYGVNILCNYYCPIKKQNMALHPVLEVDCRGKVLCGVGMSFNF